MKIQQIYRRELIPILMVLVCSAAAAGFVLVSAAGVLECGYQRGKSGLVWFLELISFLPMLLSLYPVE